MSKLFSNAYIYSSWPSLPHFYPKCNFIVFLDLLKSCINVDKNTFLAFLILYEAKALSVVEKSKPYLF